MYSPSLQSLARPPSLARCVSCFRLPPPPPPSSSLTFFLSVKAAFQMLISSRSKRETARGGMTETSGRFHHIHTDCKVCVTPVLFRHTAAAHPLVSHLFHTCTGCCLYHTGSFLQYGFYQLQTIMSGPFLFFWHNASFIFRIKNPKHT